jgi:hypothetical protein
VRITDVYLQLPDPPIGQASTPQILFSTEDYLHQGDSWHNGADVNLSPVGTTPDCWEQLEQALDIGGTSFDTEMCFPPVAEVNVADRITLRFQGIDPEVDTGGVFHIIARTSAAAGDTVNLNVQAGQCSAGDNCATFTTMTANQFNLSTGGNNVWTEYTYTAPDMTVWTDYDNIGLLFACGVVPAPADRTCEITQIWLELPGPPETVRRYGAIFE